MEITRGMRRRSERAARRRERMPVDALVAGVDLGKRESVVMARLTEGDRHLRGWRPRAQRISLRWAGQGGCLFPSSRVGA
jgi:hypothetical protein